MDIQNKLQVVLDIGTALSSQKDSFLLFDMIVSKNMEITNCDAGILYICNDEKLEFHIMNFLSVDLDMGSLSDKIDFYPISMSDKNICAFSASHKRALNISDIYSSDQEFDFSWSKKYDAATGYHTKSMLVVPLIDINKSTVGVLQLVNAMDTNGNIIPFDKSLEDIIFSLASQTAVAISNMKYQRELQS